MSRWKPRICLKAGDCSHTSLWHFWSSVLDLCVVDYTLGFPGGGGILRANAGALWLVPHSGPPCSQWGPNQAAAGAGCLDLAEEWAGWLLPPAHGQVRHGQDRFNQPGQHMLCEQHPSGIVHGFRVGAAFIFLSLLGFPVCGGGDWGLLMCIMGTVPWGLWVCEGQVRAPRGLQAILKAGGQDLMGTWDGDLGVRLQREVGLLRWLISLTFLLESVRVDSVFHSRSSPFLGISEIKLLSSVGTYSTDDLLKDQLRFQPQKQTYFPP